MWSILVGVLSGIMLAWLILAASIWLGKPDDLTLGDMIRLLPDLLRLFKRMATDGAVPRMVRVELTLVLGYIFSPIQLIPDFIPVIGFLDDAVLVAIMLRIVVRTRARRCCRNIGLAHRKDCGRCVGSVVWPNPAEGAHA